MIKGLVITPPVLGRIGVIKVVENNSDGTSEIDGQFTITSQVQGKDSGIKHPLNEQLSTKAPNQKLKSIPVNMVFNDPELNLRAEYIMFDKGTGKPQCIGDGENSKRIGQYGVEKHGCSSPHLCAVGQEGKCSPYGRLYVNLDESDEFGTFVLRITSFNSIKTLTARLRYYHAASGNLLSCLPLQLILRSKSSTSGSCSRTYDVDLTLRDGMSLQEAITVAKETDEKCKAVGFYQDALDKVARQGYSDVCFSTDDEELFDRVENEEKIETRQNVIKQDESVYIYAYV